MIHSAFLHISNGIYEWYGSYNSQTNRKAKTPFA